MDIDHSNKIDELLRKIDRLDATIDALNARIANLEDSIAEISNDEPLEMPMLPSDKNDYKSLVDHLLKEADARTATKEEIQHISLTIDLSKLDSK